MAFTSAAFADDTPVPTGNFLSSLKQSFSEDYEHEVVRGHFDIGPAPNSHRYYCLVNPNTGKTENNGIAGTPVRRRDGMTGIEGASVSFYSCSDAESKGLLVTNEYHVTIASAPHAPQVPALPVIQDRSPKSTTTDPMAVLRSFIDVFNGGDSAALASLLIDSTEFAWVQPDGSAVFGRQAAAEALQALHFSGSTLQLETENGRTISAASNTVILIIKLRLTQQSQDPRMIRCSGVMVETPKGWRIASLFMTPEATSRNARR
jgi:ketosteroid isomerase-like protein